MSSDSQRVSIVYLTPRPSSHGKSLKYAPKTKSIANILVKNSDTIEQLLLQQQPEGKRALHKDNTLAFYFTNNAEGESSICPEASGKVFKHGKDMQHVTMASVVSALGTPVSKIAFVADTWQADVRTEMTKHFKISEQNFQNGWFANGRLQFANENHLKRVEETFSVNCELMVPPHPPPPPYSPTLPLRLPASSHTARVHRQFHRNGAAQASARSRLQTNDV